MKQPSVLPAEIIEQRFALAEGPTEYVEELYDVAVPLLGVLDGVKDRATETEHHDIAWRAMRCAYGAAGNPAHPGASDALKTLSGAVLGMERYADGQRRSKGIRYRARMYKLGRVVQEVESDQIAKLALLTAEC